MEEKKNEDEEQAFKEKLVIWLKDNKLKLSQKNSTVGTSHEQEGASINTCHGPLGDCDYK